MDILQVELCLYMKIVENPNTVMFAGDTCQTIARGVAFRFEECVPTFYVSSILCTHTCKLLLVGGAWRSVKSIFFDMKIEVPVLTPLEINYRTHNGEDGSITNGSIQSNPQLV